MTYLIALVLSLTLLIVGIIKIKVHPFFVLLFSAIAYGFMTGMDINTIINAVNNGFGDIMGKIGLIILFGVTIGKVLEKSGGAFVIASGSHWIQIHPFSNVDYWIHPFCSRICRQCPVNYESIEQGTFQKGRRVLCRYHGCIGLGINRFTYHGTTYPGTHCGSRDFGSRFRECHDLWNIGK